MSIALKTPCPSCGDVALESFRRGEASSPALEVLAIRTLPAAAYCHTCKTYQTGDALEAILKAEAARLTPAWSGTDAGDPGAEQGPEPAGVKPSKPVYQWTVGAPSPDNKRLGLRVYPAWTDEYAGVEITAAELARVVEALKGATARAEERQQANAALLRDNGKLTEELQEKGRVAAVLRDSQAEIREALEASVGESILAAIRDLRERAELGDLARKDAHVLREELQRETLLKMGARAEADRLRAKLAEALTKIDASEKAVPREWLAKEHRKLREYLQGRGLWRPIGTDRTGGAVGCAIECMEANRELAADLADARERGDVWREVAAHLREEVHAHADNAEKERSRAIGIAANFLTVEAEANLLRAERLELGKSIAEKAHTIQRAFGRIGELKEDLARAQAAGVAGEIRAGLRREIDGMRDALVPLVDLFDFGPDGEPVRSFGDAVAAAVVELRQRRKDADGGLEEDRDQWRAACRAAEQSRGLLTAQLQARREEAEAAETKIAAADQAVQRERRIALDTVKRHTARADALAEGNRALGLELETTRKDRDNAARAHSAAGRQLEEFGEEVNRRGEELGRLRALTVRMREAIGLLPCSELDSFFVACPESYPDRFDWCANCEAKDLLADPDGLAAEAWHRKAVEDAEERGYHVACDGLVRHCRECDRPGRALHQVIPGDRLAAPMRHLWLLREAPPYAWRRGR